jgi:hypothetical protein
MTRHWIPACAGMTTLASSAHDQALDPGLRRDDDARVIGA